MNKMTPILIVAGIVIGMIFAWALGAIFSSDSAPWVGIRDLRGCWSSGQDTLLIQQEGSRSQELEARFGNDEQWRDLATSLDGDVISAHFSGEPDLYEFRFEAGRDADRLTVISALGDERSLTRCEPTA